jgi:hypothetical protein
MLSVCHFCTFMLNVVAPSMYVLSLPEVNVENADSDADGESDEHHREQEILAEERNGLGPMLKNFLLS